MRLLGTSALVPDLLVRAPEVLRLLAAPDGGAGRRAAARPGRGRRLAARHRRPPAPTRSGRGRHRPLAAPPRAAARRVRGPARRAVHRGRCAPRCPRCGSRCCRPRWRRCSGRWRRRPRAARAVGGDRHGPARRGRAGLRQRRRRAVRLRARRRRDRAATPCATRPRWPRPCAAASARPSPDPALVVDADLRPEGRNGPLVRTLESYRAYYARWSEAWEAQALLRASPVAGDADLGVRFVEMVDPVRYPAEGLDPATVTEIRRIKARVDAERLPRGADRSTAHQARPRRARRRRVDGAAAAAAARGRHPRAAHHVHARGAARGGRGGAAHAPRRSSELAAGWTHGHPGPQRRDAGARQAGRPAAPLGPRAGRGRRTRWATRPTATPGSSSTTTAAPPAAPAPSSSGSSTAGRPNPRLIALRRTRLGGYRGRMPSAATLLTFALAGIVLVVDPRARACCSSSAARWRTGGGPRC